MPRVSLLPFENKTRGLWVSGPRETTPKDYLRRNQATHLLREREIRSRNGTTASAAIAAAHSLHKFNDVRFQGATTVLYRNAVSISTGYDGTPLEFAVSEPLTGTNAQYLFVSGGGQLKKVDTSGTVTNWGIAPPSSGNWGASIGGSEEAVNQVTVVDPQERTIAATTSTTGWTAFGDVNSTGAHVSFNQDNPSGAMICAIAADDETIQQEG
jgi:hypothetical protein